ncbi:MAG: S8 family peptidase [Chloroflexi bacterium]|nr:S8 family peptidase [Chloroflexota bacterium]
MHDHSSQVHPPPVRRIANWARLLTALVLISLMASSLAPGFAQAASSEDRVNPLLLQEATANPNRTFRVIIQRVQRNRSIDNTVVVNRGRKLRDMRIDGFVAELPGRLITALARSRNVRTITYDVPMVSTGVSSDYLATAFPYAVEAHSVWFSGATGAGIGVGVVDSGIDTTRPDWCGPNGTSRLVARQVFGSGASAKVTDLYGHGTHVAGIIAGNAWCHTDPEVRGKYIGIAPEANLIDLVVSDAHGVSYTSDVIDAIEWAIANRTEYNIRVLNLSLVSSVAESYRTSVLSAAVERAWFSGIFVVVAAGNAGANTMVYPPANDPFVLTVGAADPKGTGSRLDDGMAPWSSYGLTQDGYTKPDLVAPGRLMPGPRASDSTWATVYPDRVIEPGQRYLWMSGTSMAAPVVAGIAALAFQQHPEWTNDQLKWLLTSTAYQLTSPSVWPGQGSGQADAAAVVLYNETPAFANQGLTISNMLVMGDGATTYASANWSTANWSTANWSTSSLVSTTLDGEMVYQPPSDGSSVASPTP